MADDHQSSNDPTTDPSTDTSTDPSTDPGTAETTTAPAAKKAAAKKTAAKKAPAKKAAAKKAPAKKTAAKKVAAADGEQPALVDVPAEAPVVEAAEVAPAKKAPAKKAAAKKAPAKKAAAKKAPAKKAAAAPEPEAESPEAGAEAGTETSATDVLFQAPVATTRPTRTRKTAAKKAPVAPEPVADEAAEEPLDETTDETTDETADETAATEPAEDAAVDDADSEDTETDTEGDDESDDSAEDAGSGPRRRRRRGGRRRRKSGEGGGAQDGTDADAEPAEGDHDASAEQSESETDAASDDDADSTGTSSRRRRSRSRNRSSEGDSDNGNGGGGNGGGGNGGGQARARRPRSPEDEITSVQGSTRLEAKKQRRREGREAGRRRAPIVSEAEFLARRESVERVMVVRQREELTQIGVLEDKVLVEHYVARESQTSLIGNIYLGRVQNVLPSMEAAFIDIGKGRNAVLYAGEVNWQQLGHKDGQPRKIESVLSSGQTILVQVTKDPIGHKGARLTSQISLAGRFLVYVPDGTTSGISRKLPDTERNRLKTLLKEIVPDTAGVIVRTAAEGASEEELTSDVERLKARWEDIEKKTSGKASSPQLLYGEPDLTLKIVRDLFTEDFAKLVVQGDDVWDTVQGYVAHIAPDLEERLEKYVAAEHNGVDLFGAYRIEEQIAKALDRKVWLPSGGSLVIDRTEAMTVVDVNTGKFTGSGGNLEETVTKNNLEAAEEVVRQLRLRDIGGIIVVDFIDMVLESNRDLVLRRLVECLGRDRTRHQVAEVTSLGLVQMTRKRIGTGLLESFSENCEHCHGRGVVVHDMPVDPKHSGGGDEESRRGGGRSRRGRGRGDSDQDRGAPAPVVTPASKPSPAEFAAMAKLESHRDEDEAEVDLAVEAAAVEVSETSEPVTVPEVAVATEAAAPRVVTRTRRGASRTAPVSAAPVEPEVEEPEPVAPAEPAAPKVVTRTRRGASRTAPVSTAPVEPVADEPVAAEPVVEEAAPAAPVEPTAPVEPAAPKVVTRTRRGVSRTVAPTAPAQPVAAATPAPAPAVVADAVATAPAPPRVVTRTRGGASSAGAAASTATPSIGAVGTPAGSGAVEPGVADLEPGADAPEVGHVPVKKRGGARKR